MNKIHNLISGTTRAVRKRCNAEAFIQAVRKSFLTVPDDRQAHKVEISMAEALMSAFAVFSLKDPSLLAFDKCRKEEPENLHAMYWIEHIACDSQTRELLDPVAPKSLHVCVKIFLASCFWTKHLIFHSTLKMLKGVPG